MHYGLSLLCTQRSWAASVLMRRALGRVLCAQCQTEGESWWQNSPVTAWICVEAVYWLISMCPGRLYLSFRSEESLCSLNSVSGVICHPSCVLAGLISPLLPGALLCFFILYPSIAIRFPLLCSTFPHSVQPKGAEVSRSMVGEMMSP